MAEERLQKIMAAAGVASRRASEEMIMAGRVKVDGQVVTELGVKVDASKVTILVDGRPLNPRKRNVYLKLYKPRGMLSDIGGDDPNRASVESMLPPGTGRVFPVGRLDYHSEGLMLMTDDGPMAHRLTHPRYEHPKTYYVLVTQQPGEAALQRLRQGVEIETGLTSPAQVTVAEQLPPGLILDAGERRGVWLRFILREGKKRQIRHMVAEVEMHLLRLVRWAIGPLTLENMQPRTVQPLTDKEIRSLHELLLDNPKRPRRTEIRDDPKRLRRSGRPGQKGK
ncbi:MAG: rRNA pseudouridine synthase [Caldilineaceae bacterium]|nr:rRNA pseudouridine synthase [Caldilineaceae bacterium]